MTTITITRTDTGKLDGFKDRDRRAFARFKEQIEKLEPGELFMFDAIFGYDTRLWGRYFAMIDLIFDSQEFYDDRDTMRAWLTIGAGHVVWVPSRQLGELVPVPKTVSPKTTDDDTMRDVHRKTVDFMRTEYARRTLWPHLTDQQTYDTVAIILEGFD